MDEQRLLEIEKFSKRHHLKTYTEIIAALRDERKTSARLLEYITALIDGMSADQFNALVDAGKLDGIRAYMEGVS